MYILYLDESGNHREASYFVLAGLAVFERETYWFSQDLDYLQREYFPEESEPVFFHAARLRTGRNASVIDPWNRLTPEHRRSLRERVYDIIRNRRAVLFACAVEKRFAEMRGEDPYGRAFEELINRFDLFMRRINRQEGGESQEQQRGLVVLAESNYERTLTLLAQRVRREGTRWGTLRNFADVPLFAPARDTRLLQYADFCANAVYGRYNSGLSGDFDRIAHKFDRDTGVVHGLVHLTTDSLCSCLACFSRHGS